MESKRVGLDGEICKTGVLSSNALIFNNSK